MCGRFVNALTIPDIRAMFAAVQTMADDAWKPTWNAAPTHQLPVVVRAITEHRLGLMRWGWPKEFAAGIHVNAFGETAHQLKTFQESFQHRRCLIPATDFYEWVEATKQPWYFSMPEPFAILGLWQRFVVGDKPEVRFLLLTAPPGHEVAKVHHRMSAIVSAEDGMHWLDPSLDPEHLLSPIMESQRNPVNGWEVSYQVNKVSNNHKGLLRQFGIPLF